MPPAPVEALVALSIVCLAVEIARRDRAQPALLTGSRGWWRSPSAAARLRIRRHAVADRIPPGDIPLALLSFNVGVEAGQIGFIAAALALFGALRTLEVRPHPWMQSIPAYTIGSLASFWFLQRCAMIFG